MKHCGMDIHHKYSRACVVDEDGDVLTESKFSTSKKSLQHHFADQEPMRIILETGTHSNWIARSLRSWGHEVIVAHARRIKLICENRKKNDRIDAEILARLGRSDLDLLTETHVRGEGAQRIRTMLKARRALVECRTKLANQVRGVVRAAGYSLPGGKPARLEELVDEADLEAELLASVLPLASCIGQINTKIDALEQKLKTVAGELDIVERLKAITGVGWQTALCFVVSVEEPGRFSNSKKVGAYFGLDPEVNNSGNEDTDDNNTGCISKRGDSLMRWLLVQAAHSLMRSNKDSELKRFAERVKAKKGTNVAAVACARKLAVLMHTLWVTGRDYQPFYHREHFGDGSDEEASN